jgi:hypothetical protein
VALLALLLSPPAAVGAPDTEAIIKRGVDLRKKGDDEAALREFKRAYGISATPRAAAQMGMAEQSLGRWPDAEAHLAEAVASRGDTWVEKNRAVLEESLRTVRSRVGRLMIAGQPAGARIAIDGQPFGTLPLDQPLRLLPGPARLEVRAPGHEPFFKTVSVPAGQVTHVQVQLDKERPLPTPNPAAADPPEVHEEGLPPQAQPQPEAPPDETPPWLRTTRRVSLVATGVALAVGVAGLVMHELTMSDFNKSGCKYKSEDNSVWGPRGAMDAGCRSKYDNAAMGKNVAVGGLIGTGALASTSAVFYFGL